MAAGRRWAVGYVAVAVAVLAGCGPPMGREAGEGPGGRAQPLALSPEEELAVGRKAARQVMDEYRGRVLPDDSPETRRVRQITQRIVKATQIEPLDREINLRLRGYTFEWETHVVRDKQANAFCLPAGKIFVLTGILPVAGDDGELATVLSHEIAHALAHHASERVAREQSGSNPLRALSYDRMQESEADHIGVFLMPFAGYDPGESVTFWRRMQRARSGGEPPEFLSDHPSTAHRIHDLEGWSIRARAAKQAYDQGRIAPSR